VVDFFLPKTSSSGTLATLPLPPRLQIFFITSTMLWAHFIQKWSQ